MWVYAAIATIAAVLLTAFFTSRHGNSHQSLISRLKNMQRNNHRDINEKSTTKEFVKHTYLGMTVDFVEMTLGNNFFYFFFAIAKSQQKKLKKKTSTNT